MPLTRYKITIEYMGARYAGWQRQADGLAVQEVIEDAIKEFTKEDVTIYAAGRTDAGVNAYGQVAHFDLEEPHDPYRLTGSLNHFLKGHEVGIVNTEIISEDFHARFSASKRHYVYRILNRKGISIVDKHHKLLVRENLDINKMREAANYLIGKHDFSSFRASICQSKSPIKTLDEIRIEKRGDDIEIYCSALSFLHNMVRNIVGSLLKVGNGSWEPEKMKEILEAKDRCFAGPTAPAHALYFLKVEY